MNKRARFRAPAASCAGIETGAVAIVASIAIGLLVLLADRSAGANCGMPCDFHPGTITVEPALECLATRFARSSCGCDDPIFFRNNCDAPIYAQDFDFAYQRTDDPKELWPGTEDAIIHLFEGNGFHELVVHMKHKEQVHAITITARVTDYGKGGCNGLGSIANRPTVASIGVFSLAVAVGMVAFRVANWRRHRRMFSRETSEPHEKCGVL